MIRKCDTAGVEIAGASLEVSDLDGNVIDSWVSEEGASHVIRNVEVGVPYCLTETQEPVDYLIAAPIYFQLEENGTVSILTYELDSEGNLVRDEADAPVLIATTAGVDRVVTMVDEYIGVVTTPEVTTAPVETTTEVATETTPHNTDSNHGEQTPAVSTTTSAGETTTTAAAGGTTTTGNRSNSSNTSYSNRSSGSGSYRAQNISSTPKTKDAFAVVLVPTALAAFAVAAATRRKNGRKKK